GGREGGREDVFDVSAEGFAVHGAVEDERRREPGGAQGGDEGRCLPVSVRDGGDQTMAALAAAALPRHVGRRPGLVNEDEPGRVHRRLPLAPRRARGSYIRPAPLGGVE